MKEVQTSGCLEVTFSSSLHDALPGMYYHSEGLRIHYASKGCFSLTGYQAVEFANQSVLQDDLIHPSDREHFRSRLHAKAGLVSQQYRILTQNQEYKWVRDEFIVQRNENVLCIEGHITEIQETQYWQVVLRQLMAYRDAVNVNMISSLTDAKGVILYVNKNFCDVSKYTEEELLGKTHSIINSGHHSRSFFTDLWKTIAGGNRWHGEVLNRAKDGSTYWVDSVIIPVFGERDTISHYLSLRTLITGRKEAEKQKEEYIHILEEIAFMVAHRIRGPLCSIAGLVNLLEPIPMLTNHDKMALHYLRSAVNEMDSITRELSTLLHTREVDLKRKDYQDKIENAVKKSRST